MLAGSETPTVSNAESRQKRMRAAGDELRELVYICSEYPGVVSRFGGLGVSVCEEARWFAAQGHDVTVICQTGEMPPGKYKDDGVTISVLPVSGTPKLRAFTNRLLVAREVKKTLRDRSGLAICPDYSGPLWLKRFKQPLIVQLHGSAVLNAAEQGKHITRKDGWFERSTTERADGIQAYSHYAASRVRQLFRLSHRPPVWIIPHPVDAQQFHPDPSAVKPHEILFVGKLNALKGAFELAEAATEVFQAMKQVSLVVVGGDHQEAGKSTKQEFLNRIPGAFHHRIRLVGHLSRAEVAPLMRRAGVVVLPSHVETFGIVILEAMASGRPVVASARGAIPEVVRDGVTGLLADPKAPSTFARALLTLLNNPDRANRMGETGRSVVLGEYTPDRVYRRVADFHSLLINYAST